MVNRAIVIETIKKMYDSGIDDSVVEQTLKDIGLKKGEIGEYLAEAKGGTGPAGAGESAPLGNNSADAIRRRIDETHEMQEALHTTTHVALEEHGAKVDAVHERVSAIEERLSALAAGPGTQQLQDGIIGLNVRIASLEQQVRDLKASVNATKSVMDKILETSREIAEKL
ncbi:MAG: hypothetical protein NTW59_03425 [Candidatus Diapherotrites archaeon]|nr:hypothetical protein [Candidatus Diapherotrites archaeon]